MPRFRFGKIRRNVAIFALAVLLVVVVAAHFVVPPLILRSLNRHLAEFSPVYSLHIKSLGLNVFRMAYKFREAEAFLKADGHRFLSVEELDVSIAWRELLHGRVLTDVVADGAAFVLSKNLLQGSQAPEAKPKEDANEVANKLFPVRISRIELHRAAFQFANLINQPESARWRVSSIEGRVLNLTPSEAMPLTFFTLQGTMLESSTFKLAGKAKRLEQPLQWKADLELRSFDLRAANEFLMHSVPLSFTQGKLDLYAEALAKGGETRGYVKPFFKDVRVIGNKGDFKGVKHFGVEILAAIADVILRKADDHTVAMRVPFTLKGRDLKVEGATALGTAVGHGFGEPVAPAIEDKFELN